MTAGGGDGSQVVELVGRRAVVTRQTRETSVTASVDLDGSGRVSLATGIGFWDHLLGSLGHHGLFDLDVRADGDLTVDEHHTVEDVALALGQALSRALGDKAGVARYGFFLPMDEASARYQRGCRELIAALRNPVVDE